MKGCIAWNAKLYAKPFINETNKPKLKQNSTETHQEDSQNEKKKAVKKYKLQNKNIIKGLWTLL